MTFFSLNDHHDGRYSSICIGELRVCFVHDKLPFFFKKKKPSDWRRRK